MQIYVPNSVGIYTMNSDNTDGRKSGAQCCQKCKKLCDKLLQLPECGHQFCKRCLNEYSGHLSSWTDEPDYFSCPLCGAKVSKPELSSSKRSRKPVIKKRAKFYTTDSYDTEFPEEKKETERTSERVEVKETETSTAGEPARASEDITAACEAEIGNNPVKVRDSAVRKSKTLHRTAVRFSTYDFSQRFSSRISSDEKACLYFGGDLMPNGDILLADWANFSLKLFEPSGHFISSCTLKDAPLDVTVVRDDMMVVSFGTRCTKVVFMAYMRSSKVLNKLGSDPLPGFLYSTTKYEDGCIGIFEKDGHRPLIVRVNIDRSKGRSGSGRRTVTEFIRLDHIELSSASGIFYNPKDSRLYVSSRRRLLCFNRDRELLFKKRFPCGGADLYFLGSITCDVKGVTYVASDNCILRLSADGDVESIVPTPEDPYHILMIKDLHLLVLIGKEGNISCHCLGHGK